MSYLQSAALNVVLIVRLPLFVINEECVHIFSHRTQIQNFMMPFPRIMLALNVFTTQPCIFLIVAQCYNWMLQLNTVSIMGIWLCVSCHYTSAMINSSHILNFCSLYVRNCVYIVCIILTFLHHQPCFRAASVSSSLCYAA